MFSSELRAVINPACKSARTLDVPPGFSDLRFIDRLGDGGGIRLDELVSIIGSPDDDVIDMSTVLSAARPSNCSSARVRARPSKWRYTNRLR